MCLQGRTIFNKYTRQSVFVPCGHCKECQQEKADRLANRLKNTSRAGYMCFFVTLTYSNEFCPYVLRNEIDANHDLNIYRDNSFVRTQSPYGFIYVQNQSTSVIDTIAPDGFSYNLAKLLKLRGQGDNNKIGVIYYPDLQNYIKNLKIKLERNGINDKLTWFACAEYGTKYSRPHFHLLIWSKIENSNLVRSAIAESWRFSNPYVTRRGIEVAKQASSYVSSYLNKSACLSEFLEKFFPQKHSGSHDLGTYAVGLDLPTLLSNVRERNCTYFVTSVKDGISKSTAVPYQKRHLNRYFPKFKGYCELTNIEVTHVLQNPSSLIGYLHQKPQYIVDDDYLHTFRVRLKNCWNYYHSIFPSCNYYDYIHDYIYSWSFFESHLIQQNFERLTDELYDDVPYVMAMAECYDNIVDFAHGSVDSLNLREAFDDLDTAIINSEPNSFLWRKADNMRRVQHYDKVERQKLLFDLVNSELQFSSNKLDKMFNQNYYLCLTNPHCKPLPLK